MKKLVLVIGFLVAIFYVRVIIVECPRNLCLGITRTNFVVVEVHHNSMWVGNIQSGESFQGWQGNGYTSYLLERPPNTDIWEITVSVKKFSDTREPLVVKIINLNGDILAEKSTAYPFGPLKLSLRLR